jgi:putative two-component system response regulator
MAREIAWAHHEKWDGSGYPRGLSGDDIPVAARLMGVPDVYDALISERVYKPAFPHGKAVSIIREGSGSHFQPDIVEAFLDISYRFREIAQEYGDRREQQHEA